MALDEYARKRQFDKTPEPSPSASKMEATQTRGGCFCVQRHAASHLHYDFRLEVGGVLASWAVPKGPNLDPVRKPLAMKVEDHPLAYGSFEGNIPKGSYGGGSVMLWDHGRYEVLGDKAAEEQLKRGDFKFALHGTKLNGSFAIVRMKSRGKGNEWLLIKKKDEFAVTDYDIDDFPLSVATGRTQEQIAEGVDLSSHISLGEVPGAIAATVLTGVEPMLAMAVKQPPVGDGWAYEIKWDGVRALCSIESGSLAMITRRGNRCEQQYPELEILPRLVTVSTCVLDGEVCVLDDEGRARFGLIQPRISANAADIKNLMRKSPVCLFLFDALFVDGYDLRKVSLEDRRRVLNSIVKQNEFVRVSETFESGGAEIFEAAKAMRLEGIVAKRRKSQYVSGRSSHWQKIKVLNEQEFIITGFTKGARSYFGALVLGLFENDHLRHVGQVGTGFDTNSMREIDAKLNGLVTRTNPFKAKPKIKGVTWVKPELICQVQFQDWTEEGNLRAPVFIGLRDDKEPSEVVNEKHAKTKDVERLDGTKSEQTVEIEGHLLKFSNLKKVFYPKQKLNKFDLLTFYEGVGRFLLPHLKDRPLSLKRYPNGIDQPYFFQKNASQHFPSWLQCEPITEGHPPKVNHYPLAQNLASLLYLVNLGCIDQNPWMSRVGSLDHPDWILLDLDPVEASFDRIIDAAVLVGELLQEMKLRGYCKTTGGDGLHIYIPIEPNYTFEQARTFAELLAQLATDREPKLFTTPRSVAKREKGKVYFDYLQIGSGKTIAAPYVLRAYDGAPVATPLQWSELRHGLRPSDFRIDNALERFGKVGDLFAPVLGGGQKLETALEILGQSATR